MVRKKTQFLIKLKTQLNLETIADILVKTFFNAILILLLQTSKKSSFYKFHTQLALYSWILKLKSTLVAKYTVYFYEILAANSSATFDIKTYWQNYLWTTSTSYVFPNPYGSSEFPTGLDSFPAVLSLHKSIVHYSCMCVCVYENETIK